MLLADASIFIGRFHPLLVHLPIGFLLLAAILAISVGKQKYQAIQPAVTFALAAGAASALLACITGFILSSNGDYDQETLSNHMSGGFITAGVALVAWLISTRIIPVKFLQTKMALFGILAVMVLVISVTGHLGGTLTHGSGYISSDLLFNNQLKKTQITDINEALVYEDLVQPILSKKCIGCHNSSKKKGAFSLATYQALIKGGKHGKVIEPGDPVKSELIKRVTMDPRNEKFMPADNKPSLTETEKNILAWWISKTNASNIKKVKDFVLTANVRNDLVAYLGLKEGDDAVDPAYTDSSSAYYASLTLPKISEQQILVLKQSGFVVKYISLNPVLLDITLPADKDAVAASTINKLKVLVSIKDHVTWLNISGNDVVDEHLRLVASFKNLQRVKLNNNPVTDAGIALLKDLSNLQSLSCYNTKVSRQGLAALDSLPKLKHLYVWGTGVEKSDSTARVVTGVN